MFKSLSYFFLVCCWSTTVLLAQSNTTSAALPSCCHVSAPATLPICCIPSTPATLPACCTASSSIATATPKPVSTPIATPAQAPTPTPPLTPSVTPVAINEEGLVKIEEGPPAVYIAVRCITANQYCAFLNAVASTADPYQLYKIQMGITPPSDPNLNLQLQKSLAPLSQDISCISRTITNGHFVYSVMQKTRLKETRPDDQGNPTKVPVGDLPVTYLTLFDAVRFCNWMHHGQPIAPEGPDTTESGAYTMNHPTNPFTGKTNAYDASISWNQASHWRLPTQEQWNIFSKMGVDKDYDYFQWIDARDVNRYNPTGPYMSMGYFQAGIFNPNDAVVRPDKPIFRLPETPSVNCGFRLVRIGEE